MEFFINFTSIAYEKSLNIPNDNKKKDFDDDINFLCTVSPS